MSRVLIINENEKGAEMKQMRSAIFISIVVILLTALSSAEKTVGCSLISTPTSGEVIAQPSEMAAAETKKKEKKAEPVFEGKPMEFNAPAFRVSIPAKNWKVEETHDPANPLILTHTNTALIQILTFQSTMTTIPELVEQLNKTFEKQFTAEGAREYAIEGSKDYKNVSMAGKRVRSHFKTESDVFVLEQIYLQGDERVFVITLMVKKPLYKSVIVDFDGMAESLETATPLPSPTPSPTSSPATLQVEEKRNE